MPPSPEGPPERRFTLELCDKKGAFEVHPEIDLSLDLAKAERQLVDYGFQALSNAGVLLVVQAGPIEVSLFESGRLLVKAADREMAEKATEATYEALGVLEGLT